MITQLPISIVRGGTSKGIFIESRYLPKDQKERNTVILRVFGSPDVRQIDGLGGADILTSKLAIIDKPSIEGVDVDYTFGQVSITEPIVDYKGNCGNISSGVAVYAIEKGYVKVDPLATEQEVKIHMVNTGRILIASVPVNQGKLVREGDYQIAGVPGSHAKIDINWADCGGETTGQLLPSSHVRDLVSCYDRDYEVSVIDAGNVTIFINAEQLGLSGIESPSEIQAKEGLMDKIEEIRGRVAEKLGLISSYKNSIKESPYTPFFSIVSKPKKYNTISGKEIQAEEIDIVSRLIFMQGIHKAHPVTGTVAFGAASTIDGTVVNELLSDEFTDNNSVNIGHPSGIINITSETITQNNDLKLIKSNIGRTARIILDGIVYI
ncbi:2-methylaconitate cis-trans isomerase PrpF family protein [Photobacterium damselae]|uniref:2-methylaconitate cis-trans isomerase PrpF family protein n=1 Tax=Photobacterium damselae TaxID=38293 RepID=UPI000D662652|nr:PrpF domain-containing protein [Photobacterium damselae]AWK84037.1 3-methylitaconate isomerase [Photobacterium damselae]